jgi:hypothetical protein
VRHARYTYYGKNCPTLNSSSQVKVSATLLEGISEPDATSYDACLSSE